MDLLQSKDNSTVTSSLEALRKASKDLHCYPFFSPTTDPHTTIEALSKLQTDSDSLLSSDPNLINISQSLCKLKTLLHKLEESQGYSLKPLLRRQITYFKIHQVASTIEGEIRAYFDRQCVRNLVRTLQQNGSEEDEEEKVRALRGFEKRLSKGGFDRDFQELILKGKVFTVLESLLCNSTCARRVREHAALAVVALVRFNRDVFVGLVMMGPILQALISMASHCSIQVLCSLIGLIRTPLIDEIELDGEIPRIISLLSSADSLTQVAALDCVCEIAYHGRKEVIEAMVEQGLIKKLMQLQRSENKDRFTETNQNESKENREGELGREMGGSDEERIGEKGPFESCVKRFAVAVEVGEGMSLNEKSELKREILREVREASVSESEAATIVAEVLWGSSP